MDTPPRRRLLPPDRDAIRAARPKRPRSRGVSMLGVAVLAVLGVSVVARRGVAPDAAESEVTGLLELRAAAPLRGSNREAETVAIARWSSAAPDASRTVESRAVHAQAALAAWLADRRPVELIDASSPARAQLDEAVHVALFPDGDGRVDELMLRAIRLR